MFILKKGHQPGVYVPLRALFLVFIEIRYQCYGTWYAMRCSGRNFVGYTYTAISDTMEILHV